jgi:hypothetical protein
MAYGGHILGRHLNAFIKEIFRKYLELKLTLKDTQSIPSYELPRNARLFLSSFYPRISTVAKDRPYICLRTLVAFASCD